MLFDRFLPLPLADSHQHASRPDAAEHVVQTFRQVLSYFGYERLLLLGISDLAHRDGLVDPTNSMLCLYVKQQLHPRVYAFFGLQHFMDERDTADEYLRQAQRGWEMGFDGLKLFETKPSLRKKLGYALDSERFGALFDYAEAEQIPLTIHVSDPAYFWEGSDEYESLELLRQNGWLCDETYPTRSQLFEEVDRVMQKHPSLRLCVAHMMCDGEDVRAAERFLSHYPHTAYDLTACPSEYAITSRDPDAWRAFFLRHADRLYFGTDLENAVFGADGSLETWEKTSALLSHTYLESSEPFEQDGHLYRPLGLPESVIRKIYRDNFVARLGEAPRPIIPDRAREECERLLQAIESGRYGERLGDRDALYRQNLRTMREAFRP